MKTTGSRARSPREQIVVFGEDEHDRQSIKVLVSALRPDIPSGSIALLREPIALVKDMRPERLPSMATRITAVLRAMHVRRQIRAVLMHEDADDLEPAHERVIAKIERCYRHLPWPVYAVVPAWELETWWFLFPKAVVALHESWRAPDEYAGRDVGLIRDSKEKLKSAVRPPGARYPAFQGYSEADSPRIAQKVVELGLLSPPWFARSASWLVFVAKVRQI